MAKNKFPEDTHFKVEFGGSTYWLARELTGRDFLELRGCRGSDGDIDHERYFSLNLTKRLMKGGWDRDEEMTSDSILDIPQSHFHTLYYKGLELENEEAKPANDFLLNRLKVLEQPESPSTPVSSPEVQADTSGTSPSTDN